MHSFDWKTLSENTDLEFEDIYIYIYMRLIPILKHVLKEQDAVSCPPQVHNPILNLFRIHLNIIFPRTSRSN